MSRRERLPNLLLRRLAERLLLPSWGRCRVQMTREQAGRLRGRGKRLTVGGMFRGMLWVGLAGAAAVACSGVSAGVDASVSVGGADFGGSGSASQERAGGAGRRVSAEAGSEPTVEAAGEDGLPQDMEAGAAGEATRAGASGLGGAASAGSGAGGAASASSGGQSGAHQGGSAESGGSAVAGSGASSAGAATVGGAGAPPCVCTTGECCDGCQFRPSYYLLGQRTKTAKCTFVPAMVYNGGTIPASVNLDADYWNVFCTGSSAIDIRYGAHVYSTFGTCGPGASCVDTEQSGNSAKCVTP